MRNIDGPTRIVSFEDALRNLAAKLTGYKIDIKSETQAKDAPGFRYEDYVDDYEDDTVDDFDGEQE